MGDTVDFTIFETDDFKKRMIEEMKKASRKWLEEHLNNNGSEKT